MRAVDCADETSAEQQVARGADAGFAAQQERMRTLCKALEKANRAGKPITISRLPGSASSQDSAGTACLTGDPALLMALQPQVRRPRLLQCDVPLYRVSLEERLYSVIVEVVALASRNFVSTAMLTWVSTFPWSRFPAVKLTT